jgi:hypothetical protein
VSNCSSNPKYFCFLLVAQPITGKYGRHLAKALWTAAEQCAVGWVSTTRKFAMSAPFRASDGRCTTGHAAQVDYSPAGLPPPPFKPFDTSSQVPTPSSRAAAMQGNNETRRPEEGRADPHGAEAFEEGFQRWSRVASWVSTANPAAGGGSPAPATLNNGHFPDSPSALPPMPIAASTLRQLGDNEQARSSGQQDVSGSPAERQVLISEARRSKQVRLPRS